MAGLTDILSTIQNGVVAANNLAIQMKGSLLNIYGRITTIDGEITTLSTTKISKIVVQKFTSSGTYTPTAGMTYCIIEALGGGSGGGGCDGRGGTANGVSGGGGAGGRSIKFSTAAIIGASQTVTIGAAGTGGAAGANNGGAGGDTSVGALCIGKGAAAGG